MPTNKPDPADVFQATVSAMELWEDDPDLSYCRDPKIAPRLARLKAEMLDLIKILDAAETERRAAGRAAAKAALEAARSKGKP